VIDNPDVQNDLIESLLNTNDIELIATIIELIGNNNLTRDQVDIITQIFVKYVSIRQSAQKLLIKQGDVSADSLVLLLDHEDPEIRYIVANIIGQIGSDKYVDKLSYLLKDETPTIEGYFNPQRHRVCDSVAIALYNIATDEAIKILREWINK